MKRYPASCFFVITAILFLLFSNGCQKDEEENLPTVCTIPVAHITKNSAISGGCVVNSNGEFIHARGGCCSKKSEPTIFDYKTNDGNGMYKYTSQITGLELTTSA